MTEPTVVPGLVAELEVEDFRSLRSLTLRLGPVSALLGEGMAGTSSLLLALRAVLDPGGAQVDADQVRSGAAELRIVATLRDGTRLELAGRPPLLRWAGPTDAPPPVLALPAARRTGNVPAREMITGLEARAAARMTGTVVLIEEPELYLRPQAQRYLARLLRRLAAMGNQVVYATQSPAFLNVARMEELVFVERRDPTGTTALRPAPLTPDEDFRVLSEFDAERAELFLARAALLVEGQTEKLALPFVFAALGEDADREGVTIVECGGKANIVLFARVCAAVGVPFVILHDRDARPGGRPSATDRALHARLRALAGSKHTIEMAPDFEGVAHLQGGNHKPERAWRRFAHLPVDRMPGELVRAARLALALARSSPPAGRPIVEAGESPASPSPE